MRECVRSRVSADPVFACVLTCLGCLATSCLAYLNPPQGVVTEFAEKPKGDLLKSMQVDTTVLGVDPAT